MSKWRPGDRRESVAQMVRVDQAGEYGATRIYAGQLAVLGDRSPSARQIAGMAEQEAEHRAFFDAMLARRGVRPTLLQPLWDIAGFGLGAVTAAIGPEAAMACTVAVETEIDKHYLDQLHALGDDDHELAVAVTRFRDEELEHKDTALAHGAERAPGYPVMSAVIRLGCRAAIAVSKRL
jgi:ubiquinone biosynthesis monooxygenase Coq7